MRNKLSILLILGMVMVSCEGLVDDINENPNELTVEDVAPENFLNGAQLANIVAQNGHLNRISGLYSGQLVGYTSLYSNIYGYSLSSAESEGPWNAVYIGVVTNVRQIRSIAPTDNLLQGICKVMEAHAVGTMASLMGDVPFNEIGDEAIEDPQFDGQVAVFNGLINLLGDAINDLNAASSRTIDSDIYFGGNKDQWIESAYTLQARYYMHLKDYGNAYSAAQNGISTHANSMQFIPRGDPAIAEGDKNLFWEILAGSRTGDIGNSGTPASYLQQILDAGSGVYRGNAKTDETARFAYYTIDEGSATGNLGIIEQFEPMDMVSYAENQLTLAEAGARSVDFATGLGHLNTYRQWLAGGGKLNANFIGLAFDYQDYVTADFQAGGMENLDAITQNDALLREIIEERYVSGFGQYTPFDDARRLRGAGESALGVPFPFNTGAATAHPERMPYAETELFANGNAPAEDPGIFVRTPVNQ